MTNTKSAVHESSVKPRQLVVQKYGGATLSDPEKIRSVAKRIAKLRADGHQVVAIVSAMGQTTNQLIELAHKVSHKPALRELDMLLTTGERVSMALLTMALHDLECPAISFTGSQAGILTTDSHVNAMILDVKAFRVAEALRENKVVVLAGFQGVSPQTKEITTLGRGGTDTTAVAMATFLNADRCEILKDVPAVFTADPRICADARPLAKLKYSQLADMCFWGAKVLHYRSVELAARNHTPLYVGPAAIEGGEGTHLIEDGDIMFESTEILALNSHERALIWRYSGKNIEALNSFMALLEKEQIPSPQILSTQQNSELCELTVTGPTEVMERIEECLRKSSDSSWSGSLSSVTCTCTGSASIDLIKKLGAKLREAGIEPLSMRLSPMSVSFILPRADRNKALEAFHSLIPS